MHTVTLAVTSYEEMSSVRLRGRRLLQCIAPAQEHRGIDEIVIVDDGSSDAMALEVLLRGKKKVRFVKRKENFGVWGNKIEAIRNASPGLVISCDSDNVMDAEYLTRAIDIACDPSVRYSPSFAMPRFDYRSLCGRYDMSSIGALLSHPVGECFMNTGNQITFREAFLEVFDRYSGRDPHKVLPNLLGVSRDEMDRNPKKWRDVYNATDSFFFNAVWLMVGNIIDVVDGLEYEHYWTVGKESNYIRAPSEKGILANVLANHLRARSAKVTCHDQSRNPAEKRVVQCSCLGRMGRFANQIFQYAFIKLYADEHGCCLESPPWVGNELFGVENHPFTSRLPPKREVWNNTHLGRQIPPRGSEFVNTDWSGYAQYHTSYYRPHKEQFRSFFQPLQHVRAPVDSALEHLKGRGGDIVGFHIRRGDFGRLAFHLTPIQWYHRWLDENWERLDRPSLFIATEDRSIVKEFKKWHPVTTESLGIELATARRNYNYLMHDIVEREPWQMDFFPDWWVLAQCDYLVISNSTFGFTAAMMNEDLKELWRSSLPHGYFEKIDPWDSRPFRTERVEDYPDLEGIRCEKNPYW